MSRSDQDEPLPKKERLLRSAQRLMLQQGYWATTIEQVCASESLSKGVFFHYFSDKRDLGAQTIDRYVEKANAHLQKIYTSAPDEPLERIHAVISGMGELLSSSSDSGCLLATFIIDTAKTDPLFRGRCAQCFEHWGSVLEQDFARAVQRQSPASQLQGKELAQFCIAVIEGSVILSRAHRSRAIMARNTTLLNGLLDSIFTADPPASGGNPG